MSAAELTDKLGLRSLAGRKVIFIVQCTETRKKKKTFTCQSMSIWKRSLHFFSLPSGTYKRRVHLKAKACTKVSTGCRPSCQKSEGSSSSINNLLLGWFELEVFVIIRILEGWCLSSCPSQYLSMWYLTKITYCFTEFKEFDLRYAFVSVATRVQKEKKM
jgi:hypothetical protein